MRTFYNYEFPDSCFVSILFIHTHDQQQQQNGMMVDFIAVLSRTSPHAACFFIFKSRFVAFLLVNLCFFVQKSRHSASKFNGNTSTCSNFACLFSHDKHDSRFIKHLKRKKINITTSVPRVGRLVSKFIDLSH